MPANVTHRLTYTLATPVLLCLAVIVALSGCDHKDGGSAPSAGTRSPLVVASNNGNSTGGTTSYPPVKPPEKPETDKCKEWKNLWDDAVDKVAAKNGQLQPQPDWGWVKDGGFAFVTFVCKEDKDKSDEDFSAFEKAVNDIDDSADFRLSSKPAGSHSIDDAIEFMALRLQDRRAWTRGTAPTALQALALARLTLRNDDVPKLPPIPLPDDDPFRLRPSPEDEWAAQKLARHAESITPLFYTEKPAQEQWYFRCINDTAKLAQRQDFYNRVAQREWQKQEMRQEFESHVREVEKRANGGRDPYEEAPHGFLERLGRYRK